MQTIETLWELATYADRPYGGDTEDLSPAAHKFAADEDWDLTATRDAIGEAVADYARELPLSVLIRSDWHEVGAESTYSEFEILLSTGGPAVRVLGDLDSYSEPYRPGLQFSDWGVSWTDHPESNVRRVAVVRWAFLLRRVSCDFTLSLQPVPPIPSVRPASHCLSFAPTFPYGIAYVLNRYITKCYSTASSP
jgi:hypothetical protein